MKNVIARKSSTAATMSASLTIDNPQQVPDAGQIDEFREPDKKAAKFKIEAFRPHWELINKAAIRT